MLVDNGKEKLIETIKKYISEVSNNKEWVKEIKEELVSYGITGGRIENILSDVDILKEADNREVTLITEQFYDKTRILELDIQNWYTENEIADARVFDKSIFKDEEAGVSPEVTFENVLDLDEGMYMVAIDLKTIDKLMNQQNLHYNFEIQRQPKVRKGDIPQPTVHAKNVNEIKDLLLKRKLKKTTLAFNAKVGSSISGEELDFNPETRTLTINAGTHLDILDGYHRCLASIRAYKIDPEIDFKFALMISNVSITEARQYQAQLAKGTAISKTRIKMLEDSRLADKVVRDLSLDSELKDKISANHLPNRTAGELVSYSVISDAIEREFPMKVRRDTTEVYKYLTKFFDYLIGDNQDEFLYNRENNNTLMNYNKMFAGYIALASKMQKENIDMENLQGIIENVDFSVENSIWNEIGVTDSEGKIKNTADEKKIANYFKKLEI